jgi:hypothetical protein
LWSYSCFRFDPACAKDMQWFSFSATSAAQTLVPSAFGAGKNHGRRCLRTAKTRPELTGILCFAVQMGQSLPNWLRILAGAGAGLAVAAVLAAVIGLRGGTSLHTLAIIEAAFGLCAALYLIWLGAKERFWRRREVLWTRVEATITSSEVADVYVWGDGYRKYYGPRVRYKFSLNGVEHEGTRLQMDDGRNPKSDVQRQISRYPVGAVVSAYCDPKNPSHAVLELDEDGGEMFMAGLGFIPAFALVAILFALLG